MQLKPFEEIIGTLKTIIIETNCVKLEFTITQEIEIPINSISKEKLNNCLGKMIGVLNCFDQYQIRVLKNKNSHENSYRTLNSSTV